MERDERGAAAALAEIDAQQSAMRQRIGTLSGPPTVLGLLLGALAASLAWHNTVWFTVVAVGYLVSLLPLVGTPTKVGVVPRGGRRQIAVALVGCAFVIVTPQLAVVGPWWTAAATGLGAAVFVPVFGRWRRSQERRDMGGPAVLPVGRLAPRVNAVARHSWFVPVAAFMLAGAILLAGAGWSVAILAFPLVPMLLLRRMFLIGAIPVEERTTRFRVLSAVSGLVLVGGPILSALGPGHDQLLPAAGYAAVVAITVVLVGSWQQRRLTRDR